MTEKELAGIEEANALLRKEGRTQEIREALCAEVRKLRAALSWLDRKGGLGFDVHARIKVAMGEGGTLPGRGHFVCPECGVHVAADADWLCTTCGADCRGEECRCDSELIVRREGTGGGG